MATDPVAERAGASLSNRAHQNSSPGAVPHAPTPTPPRGLLPMVVAEAVGTFGLVFAGCGAIMIDVISHGQITHVGVGLVFGLIIAAMISAFGHISGAHFNPAVTLGFVLARHFPLRLLWGYWGAQLLGAIVAAATLRLLLGNVADLGATVPAGSSWQPE